MGEGCLLCEGSLGELIAFLVVTAVLFVVGFAVWVVYGEYIAANLPIMTAALFDTGRCKVLLTNMQVIGSVAWSTGVKWPEPFKTFTKTLSIAELNAFEILPLGCVGSLNVSGALHIDIAPPSKQTKAKYHTFSVFLSLSLFLSLSPPFLPSASNV